MTDSNIENELQLKRIKPEAFIEQFEKFFDDVVPDQQSRYYHSSSSLSVIWTLVERLLYNLNTSKLELMFLYSL